MQKVQDDRDGPVAVVRLNRPDVHNALDAEMVAGLTKVFHSLARDKSVRAVVLQGEGPSFCAGGDLKWMKRPGTLLESRRLHRMFQAVYECPKPTIARVQGAAYGAGGGLVAACDIAIAERPAFLSFSEVRWGISPTLLAPFVLRRIGFGSFRAYGVSGKRMTAAEALRIGLVDEVSEQKNIDAAVTRWTDLLVQNGPGAMAMFKKTAEEAFAHPQMAAAARRTTTAHVRTRKSAEGQEGMAAFLEKREPKWRDLELLS